MADVCFPKFYAIDKDQLSYKEIPLRDMKKGEIYLMLIEIVDNDDCELIPENFQLAQEAENRIWIGYHALLIARYEGTEHRRHQFVVGKEQIHIEL